MAAFDYGRPAATAERLIKRYGQLGKLRRPTSSGPTYNPTPGAPDDHVASFVVVDFDNKDVDGSRILATDKRALMAKGALSIEPATSDLLVEADGSVYRIIDIQPLRPASVTVYYDIQVRR